MVCSILEPAIIFHFWKNTKVICQKQTQKHFKAHLNEFIVSFQKIIHYWTNGTKVMAVQRCFI